MSKRQSFSSHVSETLDLPPATGSAAWIFPAGSNLKCPKGTLYRRHGRRRDSVGIDYLCQACWKRFPHDPEIQPEGHVLGIKDVHVNHFSEGRLVLAVDLPKACQPGRGVHSFPLPHLVTLKFMGGAGTRAHQAHFAAKYVKELGQFV